MKQNLLLLLIILLTAAGFLPVYANDDSTDSLEPAVQELSAERLAESSVRLQGFVKYHEGDAAGAYRPDFDDSYWQTWQSMWYNPRELPDGWTGVRWYRYYLNVDSTLYGKTVAMNRFVIGASEIYLNGKLVDKNGIISTDEDMFEYGTARGWVPLQLSSDSVQVLAIRHGNPRVDFFKNSFFFMGMNLVIQDLKRSRDTSVWEHKFISGIQWFIVAFCLVFAIIHLLFYLFNRRLVFNLWFSIACFAYVFASWVQQEFFFYSDVETMIRLQLAMQASMLVAFAFITLFMYSVLKIHQPLYFKILFWLSLVLAVLHAFNLLFNSLIIFVAILLGIQIVYVSVKAIRSQAEGAWLLGGGVLTFILSIFLVLGLEFSGVYMSEVGFSIFHLPYLTFGIALVAMSVYQSRHLAKLNLDLTRHLREVKLLSEKNIEHERSIRDAEVQRARLETENERKTAELEKARSLQLSLLPGSLPDSDAYEMHAVMHTATEVGGDYYDVIARPDGSMIWAIGDATGHGTEAGFLAAMTKTLFQTLAPNLPADKCLREMSLKLKEAGLRKKFMCLALLHVKNDSVQWCSAGIPAALLLRAKNGTVEELESKGMPLGSVVDYPYVIIKKKIQPGDMLILMSDGLMEQMNSAREQFGMERIIECLKDSGSQPPEQALITLTDCLNNWRGEQPQQDDVSMVCLRRK